MTREEARKAAQVMLAYGDGAEIQVESYLSPTVWTDVKKPMWDWNRCKYRVKQAPDFIDWSHVAPEYKWMARDGEGFTSLFGMKPYVKDNYWVRHTDDFASRGLAPSFASYKRGTVDWKDSLVSREDWEAEQ